jgi:hypothetical protein
MVSTKFFSIPFSSKAAKSSADGCWVLGCLFDGALHLKTEFLVILLERLVDSEDSVRAAANEALRRIDPNWPKSPEARASIGVLLPRLCDRNESVKVAAAQTLTLIDQHWPAMADARAMVPMFAL